MSGLMMDPYGAGHIVRQLVDQAFQRLQNQVSMARSESARRAAALEAEMDAVRDRLFVLETTQPKINTLLEASGGLLNAAAKAIEK